MRTLARYFKLYGLFVAQHFKRLMEYRMDFIIGLGAFLLWQMGGIIFLALVFQHIPNLNGWSFDMLLFIYGFAQIPRGFDHLFTDNLWHLGGRLVADGTFDRYLLRPIAPLFHLVSEIFQADALGELIAGISLVIIASIHLGLVWGPLEILYLILFVFLGTVIYTSIKLLFASLAFWIKRSQSILWLVYTLSDFAKYPLNIYHPGLQVVISWIVPFAFTAFFPAAWFLGKIDLLTALGGTALAAGLSFGLAYTVWRLGIRAYESSGN